ncbi:putative ATP-dependent helicase [Lachnellula willkommii]|uniref:Putative ATP-dependent helicase n=1 Tax=Lachnellula willkommii TaxID=215461 RepID=A0A559MJQ4_9HELO|nr:putative ATP-dependent helicase [Lachnellula willkommii]
MRDVAEIEDELHALRSQLKGFPAEAHWFCPKRSDDDDIDYGHPDAAEEDMSPETKQEAIQAAKERHDVAYKYSLVLGMDFTPEQEDYRENLDSMLKSCDKCVYNWHMGRKAYLRKLSEDFDDDQVAELSNRIRIIDFKRINAGLSLGKKLLAEVEPAQRTQSFLINKDPTALMALYEALCCVDFHKSEEELSRHFNFVFAQIQTRKVLRLGDTLPAMARFLFHKDTVRLRFATTAWQKMKDSLTPESFDWVVHDVLSEAIPSLFEPTATQGDRQRFWQGFLLILEKMDKDLITHSLRGMEVQPDVYHLGFQHLSTDSAEVAEQVMEAYCQLLQKAPKDFWSAMSDASPTVVADRIFQSPGFEKILADNQSLENYEQCPAISWIPDFMKSLTPIHQFDACRTLLQTLLGRITSNKTQRYSQEAKATCCRAGLESLRATLNTFNSSDYKINPSTSLLVINDILGLVDEYKNVIIICADMEDTSQLKLKEVGLQVVRDALTLDCKAMAAEFFALQNGTKIQRGVRSHSQPIWQAVLDSFRPGNLDLAKSILVPTSLLTGLDELLPENKKRPNMPKDHIQYNKDFHQLMDNISRVFQRLSDFKASDASQLYQNSATARPLFGALLSADQGVYEATVEVIKSVSCHLNKQEAISDVLEKAFVPMLNSLTYAATKVTRAKTFSPTPYLIKTGRDVLKALSGNTGVLRTRSFSTVEHNAIMTWWTQQWRALDMIFSTTEAWSPRVNQDTQYLQEFCRDGMDYAEALFDQYSIFASALRDASPDGEERSAKSKSVTPHIRKVLEIVCQNVNGLTGLLRLRDAYLISVITSLLAKLLRSLGEYDLEIDDYASDFINSACKRDTEKGYRRTNLTSQQKAELQRTLYEHQGVEVVEKPIQTVTVKRQGTIDSWSQSADGRKFEPKLPQRGENLSLASHSDKSRAILKQMQAQSTKEAAKKDQSNSAFREARRKADEDRKRQNANAAAKAKALREPVGVRGEGSGIKDIVGALGKDHAPARSEIMVGSSDEDSDDDDEDEIGALIKAGKGTSKMVLEYEESRRRALQQHKGPVRKTKVQRSAKDLRARVEPNMDGLYIEILNWEIFHRGDDPPCQNVCRRIDDSYLDLNLYKTTFAPLLISEVWRSFVTAKEEANFKSIEITVLNRLSVDKFMEVSVKMPMTTNRDLKFAERDIVLLSQSRNPMTDEKAPHCLARVNRTTRKKDIIEITFRVSRNIDPGFLQLLSPQGKIYAVKIADMTTTQREYAALSSLQYYDLCLEVLEAKPSPLQAYSPERISSTLTKYNLNKGQAQAILSATDNDGFTLIQGPPGSGKTKTIVAMVGSLLTPILKQQRLDLAKIQAPVPGKAPVSTNPTKKLLICAPSNAAVDELVIRLKEGIQPLDAPRQKINVIRIGRSDAINSSVKDVMLDELVTRKLEGTNGEKGQLLQVRDKLHQDAAQIKEQLNALRPQMDEARKNAEKSMELQLQRQFDALKRNQAHIGSRIDADKESGNTMTRQNEINRRKFQQEIIDGAHVLCATLSGSGHDMFRNLNVEFETVIIDEAAQCIELSALIPLKYGCSKCILVGDPEQLPPTVLSRSAQSFGYEQSLFVRMQKNHPNDVHLLDTQYRMHPEISKFPSQQFYNGRLVDGENMAILRKQPWHASTILGPYRFFDVKGVQTHGSGHSFINIPELNAAIGLYQRLKADYRTYDFSGKIGIIATYKAQLNELKARFASKFGEGIFDEIEFNTTDAFQGREREIIIFSCVRASITKGIGFLKDIRRMNVGLTRAKSSLWVLGDSRALKQGEFWNRLIEDSKARDRYTEGDVMALLSRPTSRVSPQYREPGHPANNHGGQSMASSSTAMSHTKQQQAKLEVQDDDVEMIDAPSATVSREPSSGSDSMMPAGPDPNGIRSQHIKQERTEIPSSRASSEASSKLGKRPREAVKEEDAPAKKPHSTLTDSGSALDAAYRAQQQKKPSSMGARPPHPPLGLVAPPRKKKAPADPFIKRKPPKRP